MTYVLSTGLTQAALITINTLPVSDDFSNFGDFVKTTGPVTLDSGAIWTSTDSSSVIGNGDYQLFQNGVWNADRNGFTGLNVANGSMTYTLPFEVNYVGGFMNYFSPPSTDIIISALDRDKKVLETYTYTLNDPTTDYYPLGVISTPDGINAGAFRGISMADPLIAAFQISNGYVVLDDLTFGTVVPVPAAMWLFGSGLLGLVAVARRKVRA